MIVNTLSTNLYTNLYLVNHKSIKLRVRPNKCAQRLTYKILLWFFVCLVGMPGPLLRHVHLQTESWCGVCGGRVLPQVSGGLNSLWFLTLHAVKHFSPLTVIFSVLCS